VRTVEIRGRYVRYPWPGLAFVTVMGFKDPAALHIVISNECPVDQNSLVQMLFCPVCLGPRGAQLVREGVMDGPTAFFMTSFRDEVALLVNLLPLSHLTSTVGTISAWAKTCPSGLTF